MTSKTLDKNEEISLEEEIIIDAKKSSLGEWMLENSKAFFIIVGLLSVGSLGSVWFNNWSESKKMDSIAKVFDYKETTLKKFSDKKADEKLDEKKIVADFKTFATNTNFKEALIPVALELSNQMTDKKDALTILSVVSKDIKNTHMGSGLIKVQMASFYEDLDDIDNGIKVLSELKATAPDFLKSYTYFNLGRLYRRSGENEKAKSEFTYLIEKYSESPEAKVAKIMLSEL